MPIVRPDPRMDGVTFDIVQVVSSESVSISGSEDEKAANKAQAKTIVDALKVFRSLTAKSYFEDDVLVTHSLLEIRDVEE